MYVVSGVVSVFCVLCDVGSVNRVCMCIGCFIMGIEKLFFGFKYGCIFLFINIWNFFRKYIFVCFVL